MERLLDHAKMRYWHLKLEVKQSKSFCFQLPAKQFAATFPQRVLEGYEGPRGHCGHGTGINHLIIIS
jgi:hypothetical protein